MVEYFSASGLRVHTPFGPRKSGMPESVEMPAPVSTTIRSADPSSSRARSTAATSTGPGSAGPELAGSGHIIRSVRGTGPR
jgi:hypothetical protein